MKISEVMTRGPEYISSTATIRDAALCMQQQDSGFVPIAENNKLIGKVTDRDIVVRALANGKSPEEKVLTIETPKVLYCMEDDDVSDVLKNMSENHIQRLIVLNNSQDKDLVGVVSLGDIASKNLEADIDKQVADCCRNYH